METSHTVGLSQNPIRSLAWPSHTILGSQNAVCYIFTFIPVLSKLSFRLVKKKSVRKGTRKWWLEQHGPVCMCVCDCLKLCSAMIVAFKVHKVNKSLEKAHIVEEKGLSVRVMFKCLLHLLEPDTLWAYHTLLEWHALIYLFIFKSWLRFDFEKPRKTRYCGMSPPCPEYCQLPTIPADTASAKWRIITTNVSLS